DDHGRRDRIRRVDRPHTLDEAQATEGAGRARRRSRPAVAGGFAVPAGRLPRPATPPVRTAPCHTDSMAAQQTSDSRQARRLPETLDEFQQAEGYPDFRVDVERIRFSPYYSRLSAVTQVISQTGAGLAVHNRLTHSIKVAAVARAIATHLSTRGDESARIIAELGGAHPVVV